MVYKTQEKVEEEHEAFKNRLVAEVLGSDSAEKIPMEKVVMLIWQFRDDPKVVNYLARFVGKYAGTRRVFDGVEFYLPQLAHMIIHLEAEWDEAILERFALIIAQQSLHFALQFNWILQGAIEDYQPELPSGIPNPGYHPLYYSRCMKLFGNLERCVVYGRPRSKHYQRMYEQGKISIDELHILENADRRFQALQITDEKDASATTKKEHLVDIHSPELQSIPNTASGPYGGELLYKRQVRLGCFRRKNWKHRFFVVEEQMLNCYRDYESALRRTGLIRAMPLEGAKLEKLDVGQTYEDGKVIIKYPHMFVISNKNHKFLIRASSEEDRSLWLKMMDQERDVNSLFYRAPSAKNVATAADNSNDEIAKQRRKKVVKDLTATEFNRYEFFQNERYFVQQLTDIAEELRFEEASDRKTLAPGLVKALEIPPCVYLPLCNSSDTWRRVGGTLYKDTRVFNTKERCPMVFYFLAKVGEQNSSATRQLDVAEFLYQKFDESGKMDDVQEENGDEEVEENDEANQKVTESSLDKQSKDALHSESIAINLPEINEEVTEEDFQSISPPETESKPPTKENRSASSRVWQEDQASFRIGGGGNDAKKAKKRLRETLNLPKQLSQRLENIRKKKSIMDKATDLQLVPILEGEADPNNDDDLSSIGECTLNSVMETEIDIECINRAKKIICGGELWAEKAVRMAQDAVADGLIEERKPGGAQVEVRSLMSKSNDDVRQEVFVMQMIHYYKSVFAKAKLPIWLRTYRILSTTKYTGLLEFLVDTTSLDGLKKSPNYPEEGGLRKYFENIYGDPSSKSFLAAQHNFMRSLAGYAIVSYLLGLKDRHNGNIMIDTRGHLIFIDFGFAMGMAPGHEFTFERAPFKLTREYIDVMGGYDSDCYKEFQDLFAEGFMEARANSQIALGLVEIMMFKSNYPCFQGFRYGNGVALKHFSERLMIDVPDNLVEKKALALVHRSAENIGTVSYDKFQNMTCGYAI